MILRIYNTITGDFIRDDFTYDSETESANEGDIQGGFYRPRFDGENWVEGMTEQEIADIKSEQTPPEPSESELLKERLAQAEKLIDTMLGVE